MKKSIDLVRLCVDMVLVWCDYRGVREKAMTKQSTINQLEQIARKHLYVDTLQERKSSDLDFHEVAVWNLREALEAAYRAGAEAKR